MMLSHGIKSIASWRPHFIMKRGILVLCVSTFRYRDEWGFPVSHAVTSGTFPSRASCLLSSRRAGVFSLAHWDERSVPISRVLIFVIATRGSFPSRALRRAERSHLAHLAFYMAWLRHQQLDYNLARRGPSHDSRSKEPLTLAIS
jgi:hypothetical protein